MILFFNKFLIRVGLSEIANNSIGVKFGNEPDVFNSINGKSGYSN